MSLVIFPVNSLNKYLELKYRGNDLILAIINKTIKTFIAFSLLNVENCKVVEIKSKEEVDNL